MKAEDLIDKNSLSDFTVDKDQGVVFVPIALTAINMARKEEIEKAKKAFCRQQCNIVCWESGYGNRCLDFEDFISELNS